MKIYSKIDGRLLHIIHRKDSIRYGRVNIISENEFLQCAAIKMNKGQSFKCHQHIEKEGPQNIIAQESWIVLTGEVMAKLYDTDGEIITSVTLYAGDASFTLYGGHNYVAISEGAIVLEYKNGPYTGIENDKKFI